MGVVGNQLIFGVRSLEWGKMASLRRTRVAFCLDSFAIGGTELNAVRTAEALDPDRIELFIFHLQTHGPLRSRYERLAVSMTRPDPESLFTSNRCPRNALRQTAAT